MVADADLTADIPGTTANAVAHSIRGHVGDRNDTWQQSTLKECAIERLPLCVERAQQRPQKVAGVFPNMPQMVQAVLSFCCREIGKWSRWQPWAIAARRFR